MPGRANPARHRVPHRGGFAGHRFGRAGSAAGGRQPPVGLQMGGIGAARPVNSRDAVMGDLGDRCLWPAGERELPFCRVVLPCRAGICLLGK